MQPLRGLLGLLHAIILAVNVWYLETKLPLSSKTRSPDVDSYTNTQPGIPRRVHDHDHDHDRDIKTLATTTTLLPWAWHQMCTIEFKLRGLLASYKRLNQIDEDACMLVWNWSWHFVEFAVARRGTSKRSVDRGTPDTLLR